jgi:hypothetical protein
MKFALAIAFVVAAPLRAQQGEPKRTIDVGATLEVCVRKAGAAKLPERVAVRVVSADDLGEGSTAQHAKIERGRLDAALERAQAFEVRGGAAMVSVPRPGGAVVVVASAPRLYAERRVTSEEPGPIELTLKDDRSLSVRVVDERGRPIARVPVAIAGFETDGPIPDVLEARATRFRAVVATREADGIAPFDHVQAWMDPDGDEDSIVLLAVPHRDHEQIRITPTLLEEGFVELHAPRFGGVELRFPGVGQATVRLRERRPDPDGLDDAERSFELDEWRPNEPLALDVVDGVARCDRVGIGCVLQLEARWKGLATPFVAELAGPDRAGAVATWALGANGGSALAQTATLTGRLLDSSRHPIASRLLHGRIVTWRGGSWEELPIDDDIVFDAEPPRQSFDLVTDGSGRFDLSFGPRSPSPGVRRSLEVHEFAGDEASERRGVRGWIDVTERLVPGARDLGDLLLVGSDEREAIARTSDEGLVAECGALLAWPREATSKWPSLDPRLNEMARRGGPRLVSFFELAIASRREAATRAHEADLAARKAGWLRAKARAAENEVEDLPPPPDDDEPFEFALPLKWAVLLRRAQRKPAPITLEPIEPVSEAVTPEAPEVKLLIHDVDAGFERLLVPSLDEDRWRTTVFDPTGEVVSEPPFEPMFIRISTPVGFSSGIAPDQSYVERIPIGRRFDRARPGDYRVRVDYLIGGVVCLSSGDLPVRIKPIPIQVTRRDYDSMVSEIRAIDVSKPVALTSSPVRPPDEFDGDAKSPEDSLARRGRLALPALLDELDESTADPRRRAWILGLLWNTHLAASITSEQIKAAVGSFEWYDRWPTILPTGDERAPTTLLPTGGRYQLVGNAAPDPHVQRDLAATWTELRTWFDFTIEE